MTANIVYRTDRIARYFETNRVSWSQFYPSEQWVFERIASHSTGISRVLDVGCAAGGLGLALQDRFSIKEYVGVDLNEQAVAIARTRLNRFRIPAAFHCGDVVRMPMIPGSPFDLVANLSCSDWNIETDAITDVSWRHVVPGGQLVISLRLTNRPGINDVERSYQHIRYEEDGQPADHDERANYVVYNVRDALTLFDRMTPRPSHVVGYGYWGRPSKTAVTPYESLVFAVFAVTKPTTAASSPTAELHLPLSLWTS